MADNTFEILIKYGLESSKAKEAVKEMEKLKETTKEVGKEGVKQEEQVAEATKKTTSAKKQLSDAVKGLAHEYPILGQIGRLALSPIALSVAGIVAAFQVWKYRVDELTKSLGGIEMPDVTEDQVQRIDRMNASLERQASAVSKLSAAVNQVKSDIGEDAAIWRALGYDLGTAPEQQQAQVDMDAAEKAAASGRDKMARGAKMAPEELARLQGLAGTAQAGIDDLDKRRDLIDYMRQVKPGQWRNPIKAAQFQARYNTTSVDEAERMDAETRSGFQSQIDRYGTAVDRDRLYREGEGEISRAGGLAASGKSGFSKVAATEASQAFAAMKEVEQASVGNFIPAILKLAKEFNEATAAIERRTQALEQRNNIQSQQQ